MIRFVLRFIGLWLLAGGFVALVLDGVRSIASSRLVLTQFGATWSTLSEATLSRFQAWVEATLPGWVWPTLAEPALTAPLFAVLGGIGIVLLFLGRRRKA